VVSVTALRDAQGAIIGYLLIGTDSTARAAHMALDMLEALARFNIRCGCNFETRIGIHSGPVVAGVIGKRKFIYDLWGAAVNTASRMESHGTPGRIQVSEATRERLAAPFILEERGSIVVKDMGSVRTWFLSGRTGGSGG
jgi:adenylate cyclase